MMKIDALKRNLRTNNDKKVDIRSKDYRSRQR